MKNKKNIIGVIGDKEYKDIVSDILISNGFFRIRIVDKVQAICKLLEMDADLNSIRERGYKIGRLYWIILLLSAIPEDKKLILIDDIRLEDIVGKIMKVYYICDRNQETIPKDIEVIYINNNIEEFKNEVVRKFEPLRITN
jgi:hypothetical protein